MHVYLPIYVCVYVYTHVYVMYVCIYVYVHICVCPSLVPKKNAFFFGPQPPSIYSCCLLSQYLINYPRLP